MSVLIENMIIPPEGEYPITLYVCSDGTAYIDAWSLPQDCDKFPVVSAVRGKWILNKDGSGTCSECGFVQNSCWDLDNWDNFCHHCGADMREED